MARGSALDRYQGSTPSDPGPESLFCIAAATRGRSAHISIVGRARSAAPQAHHVHGHHVAPRPTARSRHAYNTHRCAMQLHACCMLHAACQPVTQCVHSIRVALYAPCPRILHRSESVESAAAGLKKVTVRDENRLREEPLTQSLDPAEAELALQQGMFTL
jgi:hypothetical protein